MSALENQIRDLTRALDLAQHTLAALDQTMDAAAEARHGHQWAEAITLYEQARKIAQVAIGHYQIVAGARASTITSLRTKGEEATQAIEHLGDQLQTIDRAIERCYGEPAAARRLIENARALLARDPPGVDDALAQAREAFSRDRNLHSSLREIELAVEEARAEPAQIRPLVIFAMVALACLLLIGLGLTALELNSLLSR